VEDVDIDALLKEQEKYEQKKEPNKQNPDKPSKN
jgi:hypothetical protein